MLITNESEISSFKAVFENNLNDCRSIKIASGYIGASEIENYHDELCHISKSGGLVQIIHGMGGVEGVRRNLHKKLMILDNELRKTNKNNGVFVHRTHYHGKMYIISGITTKVLIGSSNFSRSGFKENLELNFCHSDKNTNEQAILLFDRLKLNSYPLSNIKLDNRDKLKTKKVKDFDKSIFNSVCSTNIEIGVTQRSNLNLFLSKGRLNSSTGIYTPRHFYEVELTIKSENLVEFRKYLPDQLNPAEFNAITDIGTTFTVVFKRKTNGKNDTRSLKKTGIDFMSVGRADGGRRQLGEYIKGKLMESGLLNYGEPITNETLNEYGKSHLSCYFGDNNQIYLKF